MVNPLPWKKTRFSQLVADHLNSPKRGGSLVVETGFPTSLIDLIVKNRDRLKNKKASKKKRHDRTSSNLMKSPSPSSFSPSPPSSSLPSRSPDSLVVSSSSGGVSVTECSNPKWSACTSIREGGEGLCGDLNEVSVSDLDVADANRILVAVMKVSLVMILALATKRFVVGITASAILLIFFEYVGKHFCRLLKPSANLKITLDSLIQRILNFVRINRKKLICQEYIRDWKSPIRQEENLNLGSSGVICSFESRIRSPEIQVVETDCNLRPTIAEILSGSDEFGSDVGDRIGRSKGMEVKKKKKKKGVVEKEKPCGFEVAELKTRRSKSDKIKSKMKKLVPKKLRSSKRKEVESRTEATSSMGQDEVVEMSEDRELKEEEEEEDEYSLEQDVEDLLISSSCETTTEAKVEETITVREGLGMRTDRRNSGYLILFLIVLSGLVGGKVLALLITISGCFVMKSAGILRRYVKVSMTESPEKKP